MEHDLNGFQQHREVIEQLTPLFFGLAAFQRDYNLHLRRREQEDLQGALRRLTVLFKSLAKRH